MRALALAVILAGVAAADDPHARHATPSPPPAADTHAPAAEGHGMHAEGHGLAPADVEPSGGFAPTTPSPHSLFQLESTWTAADGREIPLSALGGRIVVLALVYTHCEHACPRIIADMRALRAELGEVGGRVGYVLVSIDPARDDVQRLQAFAAKTRLGDGWTLLRGADSSVRELAAALGVRYRRVSDTDFVHSNLLSILDPDGVVVHRQVGLGVDPDASAARIRSLLASQGDALPDVP